MYEGEKRSIRISGRSTTVRLERPFWSALEEIAEGDGVSLSTLISRVNGGFKERDMDESGKKNKANLASCLRVFCLIRATARDGEMQPSPPEIPDMPRLFPRRVGTSGLESS